MNDWTSRPQLTPPEAVELLKAQASARGEPVTWDYGVAERLVSRRFLRAVGAVYRKVPAKADWRSPPSADAAFGPRPSKLSRRAAIVRP